MQMSMGVLAWVVACQTSRKLFCGELFNQFIAALVVGQELFYSTSD